MSLVVVSTCQPWSVDVMNDPIKALINLLDEFNETLIAKSTI